MSRHSILLSDNRILVFGYDAPCYGYFAEIYENQDMYSDEDPIEMIGFYKGVGKNQVLDFFEKYECIKEVAEAKPEAFSNLCMNLPC